jgi:hypothetical protein
MNDEKFPPPGCFLRVKDWDTYFERAQTRRIDGPLSWVAIPTKQDGLKFSRLLARQNGLQCLGAFILLVEIGAKCVTRGVFLGSGCTPLTVRDFSRITGVAVREFTKALEVLTSNEIGWIEVVSLSEHALPLVNRVSDMRKGESREEEIREEKRGARARLNGSPSEFPKMGIEEALLSVCGLEKRAINKLTRGDLGEAVKFFAEEFDDIEPVEVGALIQDAGVWYTTEEWPGKIPTLKRFMERWAVYRQWSLNGRVSKRKETSSDVSARNLEESIRRVGRRTGASDRTSDSEGPAGLLTSSSESK